MMCTPEKDHGYREPDEDSPSNPRAVSRQVLEAVLKVLIKPSGKSPTKKNLAKKIGKSERAVSDAVIRLRRDGAEIEDGQDPGNGRLLTYKLITPPTWYTPVSPEASIALRVVLEALGNGMAGAWKKHLESISNLVEGKLSDADQARLQAITAKIGISGGRSSRLPDEKILQDILCCIGEPFPKKVEVRYASATQGEEVIISITPWCILHDLFSSTAFLLCWDWTRNAPSLLRLYRILELKIGSWAMLGTEQKAALERCARYQIGGFISAEEPEEIQVLVTGRLWVKAFQEQPPGLPDVKVEPEGPDVVRVTFMASEYRAPARWVLQLGPDARVIGPPSFVDHVANRARNTASVYPA